MESTNTFEKNFQKYAQMYAEKNSKSLLKLTKETTTNETTTEKVGEPPEAVEEHFEKIRENYSQMEHPKEWFSLLVSSVKIEKAEHFLNDKLFETVTFLWNDFLSAFRLYGRNFDSSSDEEEMMDNTGWKFFKKWYKIVLKKCQDFIKFGDLLNGLGMIFSLSLLMCKNGGKWLEVDHGFYEDSFTPNLASKMFLLIFNGLISCLELSKERLFNKTKRSSYLRFWILSILQCLFDEEDFIDNEDGWKSLFLPWLRKLNPSDDT
eukprot:TRINITY_DN17801_c0_g1_i2.p1 TRINITY_DN17801_c0_g1~~TRINITY_DN17801_c0_g1_i2.p1  ORF type:complete len:306 (-),score=98.20 TRINITY_DN17801_c0_g1_i2:97-885(-)